MAAVAFQWLPLAQLHTAPRNRPYAIDKNSKWSIFALLDLREARMSDDAPRQKTTFKARKQLWEVLAREAKAASLRRDDLLNRMLPSQIARLEAIPPCDFDGERWLKATWLDRCISPGDTVVTVPVALSAEVLGRLNNACEKSRVPRDAFFDCALSFITTRLFEAAVVIKDPDTTIDIASQLVAILSDHEARPEDRDRWIIDAVEAWAERRADFFALTPDYYRDRLSFDRARVEQERLFLRSL